MIFIKLNANYSKRKPVSIPKRKILKDNSSIDVTHKHTLK